MAADLCAQAIDDLIQGLREGGVHADEELKLFLVVPRWTGLDVREVNALLLQVTENKKGSERSEW